jgi:segregation and condensation protein B
VNNNNKDLLYKTRAPVLEALLFSSDEPLKVPRIKEILHDLSDSDIRQIVNQLNSAYEATGRTFRINNISEGYQLLSLPDFNEYIQKLFVNRHQSKLSAKALETLAIIAYKQPITRSDIEEIRGVNSDGVLRTLLTKKLITISGTAHSPGAPYLYKTTENFLEYFGLTNIKELPKLKELDEIVEADSEIQEKFGDHILKEVNPEILGMQEIHEKKDEKDETK